jgi:prepilin-type N-terminal cleavage/methylation domain-containing protein
MNRIRKNKGFTLVEIMIVVLIIGILMAIAVPNFIQARQSSRKSSCIANLKQMDAGKEQYAMDAKLDSGATVSWANLTPTYMKSQPTCPSGGTYTINTVGANPTCSITGHALP